MITETRLYGIPLAELPSYRSAPSVGDKPVEKLDHINVKLLNEIIDFIEEHPKTWDQASWFKQVDSETGAWKFISKIESVEELNSCGTSFCLAGHVALREGFPAPPLSNDLDWVRKVEGEDWPESVEEFAAKRLGLGTAQANELFAAENEIIDLKRMAFLLKVEPAAAGWELSDVRGMTDEQYFEYIKDFMPKAEED